MSRKELEEKVIEKMSVDMIYCFEYDIDEQIATLENIASVETSALLAYLED